ncbi:hypothetical protein AT1219_10328 [Vibrio alginolyticus]
MRAFLIQSSCSTPNLNSTKQITGMREQHNEDYRLTSALFIHDQC